MATVSRESLNEMMAEQRSRFAALEASGIALDRAETTAEGFPDASSGKGDVVPHWKLASIKSNT